MTEPDWTALSRRLGLEDAHGFARREIAPLLQGIDQAPKGGVELPLGTGFFAFAISFMTLSALLPDNAIGVALRFILFIPLFFGCLLGVAWLFRGRIVKFMLASKERFLPRAAALSRLSEALGMTYVAAPGGAPAGLGVLEKLPGMPPELTSVRETLDAHGGMDAPLAVALRSGVMMTNVHVLGSDADREKYIHQYKAGRRVEDGFHGTRHGLPFHAFEWEETEDDSPNIYHLVIVMDLPRKLHAVTQLRSRKTPWPGKVGEEQLDTVGVVAQQFEDQYRLRSSDQVEARTVFDPAVIERLIDLAHGDRFLAVAFEEHLVVDVAGDDRFKLVDILTGDWSEATIARTMENIAEMLELVDAVADVFDLRR